MSNTISVTSTLLLILATTFPASAANFSDHQQAIQELGCQAAIASSEEQSVVCFRDDVIDKGMATETRGCSVRLYHLGLKSFYGLGDAEILLAPQACLSGGLEAILNWPVDETSSLRMYLKEAFIRSEDVADLSPIQNPAIQDLLAEIKAAYQRVAPVGVQESTRAAPPAQGLARPDFLKEKPKHATVNVFFGSDRQYVPGQPPPQSFSNQRSTNAQVSLGVAQVSIPINHKYGNLELPSVFRVQMTPDPDRYMVVKGIARLDSDKFFRLLSTRVSKSRKKDLFVFIHGFNTSFEEAAQRTAQMAVDLRFEGAPVFYSWPAETILRYAVAEKNVEWSLPQITLFLRDLAQKSGATNIHLIAHSMGNRALTNALNSLAQGKMLKPEQTFQNVILAAPDVDQGLFRQIEKAVRSTTKSLTLYASDSDRALQISARIHKGPRLGQAGAVTLVAPQIMDTIDASVVDASFLGHSYYGDNPSVIDDIGELVMKGLPVYRRSTLSPRQSQTGGRYWQIQRFSNSNSSELPGTPE
ncbi:MAG: alpha/beta hydrolase [Pseudobdellovibrionaceae bacterium]